MGMPALCPFHHYILEADNLSSFIGFWTEKNFALEWNIQSLIDPDLDALDNEILDFVSWYLDEIWDLDHTEIG